jgi:glutamate-1-semialdehyde 2,1-aminomutase
LAVLDKVEQLGVQPLVWQRGERLQAALRSLAARHPACRAVVGGQPATPTMVFDLGPDASQAQSLYVRRMRERGYLVSSSYYVMWAHDEPRIEAMLGAAETTLAEIAALVERGALAQVAGVTAGAKGFARLA